MSVAVATGGRWGRPPVADRPVVPSGPTRRDLRWAFDAPRFLIWTDEAAEAPRPNVVIFGSKRDFLHRDGLERYRASFARTWRRGVALRALLVLGSAQCGTLLEIPLTRPEDFDLARARLRAYRPGRRRTSTP